MAKRTVFICDVHGDEGNEVKTHTIGLDGKLRELEACEDALTKEPLTVLMAIARPFKGPSFATVPRTRTVTASPSRPPIEPPTTRPAIAPVPPAKPDEPVKANGAAPAAAFKSPTNGSGQAATNLAYSPDVRAWAKEQPGLKVGLNGRMSQKVIDQYVAAHT